MARGAREGGAQGGGRHVLPDPRDGAGRGARADARGQHPMRGTRHHARRGVAEAALFAMRDPRRSISSMLVSQGGKFAVGADPGRNAATAGAHATNDRVESNFGCLDILMRMWRHATVESVSGMAQQMRMHDFDRPPNTLHDRRKRKHAAQAHSGGYFYSGLTERQRESLVEFALLEVASARDAGRQALKAQAAEKLERREERVNAMLNKAVERYAYAKELFLPVRRRPRRTGSELRPRCRWPRRCTTGSRCRTTRTAGLSRRRSSSSSCATRSRCACSGSAGARVRDSLVVRGREKCGSCPKCVWFLPMQCIFCIRMHRLHYNCITTAFADCISLHMHSMHSIAFICTFPHTLHCNAWAKTTRIFGQEPQDTPRGRL